MFLYDVSNFDSFSRCSLVFLTEQQEHNNRAPVAAESPEVKNARCPPHRSCAPGRPCARRICPVFSSRGSSKCGLNFLQLIICA